MALGPLKINTDALARLKSILSDPFYKDAVESSASTNTRLCMERKMRLPFLDAQTGVAQSDCALWMHKWQRMPGQTDGQLYSYPAHRWRKKRRQYLMNDRYLARRIRETDYTEADMHQISVVENTAARIEGEENSVDKLTEDSKDSWYRDYDDQSVDPMLDQSTIDFVVDDPESEQDDYDDGYPRKKTKKKGKNTGPKKRTRIEYTDAEKPYSCEICGVRYKTRPGLSYHYAHSHISGSNDSQDDDQYVPPKTTPPASSSTSTTTTTSQATASTSSDSPLAGLRKFQDSFLSFLKTPQNEPQRVTPVASVTPQQAPPAPVPVPPQPQQQPQQQQQQQQQQLPPPPAQSSGLIPMSNQRSASGKPPANPSPYCDFCLGDSIENKKTKQPEELVSCADCGRSAHPSCLQFTPNMTISVKKYRWQCIECKSCGLCGTSDNDDQLLFCDDCDRGYHMYCLTPPLSEPPEGLWSCHLCIEEYGKK